MDDISRIYDALVEAQAAGPSLWGGAAVELQVQLSMTAGRISAEIRDLCSGDRISNGECYTAAEVLKRLEAIVADPTDL